MEKIKILVVDDEVRVRDEIGEFLSDNDYRVYKASLPSEAFQTLSVQPIDIMILDIKLPEMNGIHVLKKVKETYPELEVIMISGHGDMQSVIEAMRYGATDFFPKPFRLLDVKNAIERTTRFIKLNSQLKEVESKFSLVSSELYEKIGHQLVGTSSAMNTIISLMSKVAQYDTTTVLITGESGTGKELVARGIHQMSKRAKSYFHSVNCSAVPETLFESEFFGHKKGAFTGAVENKMGWFEIAKKGTLFLDEISDMPLVQQAKLLRVLEERKVSRVGSHNEIDVDVRVIAASNQDIDKMSLERKFRLDLYHRLSSFTIHIPPLRERKDDIAPLLNHFVKDFSVRLGKPIKDIDDNVAREMENYSFPGNIRELRNMIERAVIICENNKLKLRDFQISKSAQNQFHESQSSGNELFDLELNEKRLIVKALKKANQNKSKAAEFLNISWQSLDRRMKKFGL